MCLLLKLRIYSQGNVVFDSVNVQINALNINTKEAEFGPFKIGNRFYYTSSRERRLGVINLDENTNHQMLDLYVGDLKDSVTVNNSQPLRNSINNSLNQGSSFFDKETSKLYYSGNIIADPKTGRYKLAIFSSEFKTGKFLEPKIELLLPDTFLASHPMIYDKKLYFSSNLKDGKGKADIYRADQVNGRWGNITNLKELNSPDNDYFPFVINEKEIYFSSDRPGGFGRLDLYKYTLENDSAVIQNLGKPVNSAFDDYSAYVDSTQETGYFTTTRNRENQDDIYHFSKTWPSFNNCVDAIKESYCYDLKDEKSLETDSLKGYFYEWDFGDGQKQKGVAVTHCYTQPGTYVVNLNIIDVSTKAVFLNQTAIDLFVDSIVQLKINALDTILVNRKVTINTLGTYLPNKKITGYYFEIDNKRIRKESFEYTFAKTGKYRIKLGIEYNDLELNTKGLMCTNLDVHIVDSTQWVPFEDRKQEEVVNNFEIHNIQAEKVVMADLDYDAELVLNEKLGLDKKKLSERIDDFLIVEEQHNHKKNSFFYDRAGDPANKNIGTNRNLLTELSEEAELTYRVHLGKSKTKMDTTVLNFKGIHGIKEEFIAGEYVYTYGNEAKPQDIDKFYQKALNAGIADVEVFGYKNNVIKMDDYVAAQDQKSGFFNKNLGTDRNLLTELSEEAELTYRVHLGKSKTKMDTTVLNAKGLYGIKEEFIGGQYVYTYGNEAKPKEIDKYYQKALSAGLANVDVFGYKNNVIKMDDYAAAQDQKSGFFNKNLGTDRNLLTELSEEAELTYRVHVGKSKTKMDTTVLNAKGLYGIKEEFIGGQYVYTYGNEAKPKDIDKYYRKALSAGVANVDVFGYKNNVIKMDDYAAAQDQKSGFFNKNLGTDRNLLTELSEEAELTYRVHLGKSKTKMDTTVLNARGLYGIKEEFIGGEYVYTYGNEAKPKNIEKYYKRALSAGLADVDVFGYKNNAIKMDDYVAAQNNFFGKNINTHRNLLAELSEEAELTYRVHLGKSKTKMDTTALNAKGIHGIKEEFIAGEYVYTYGNEAKAKDIDKYYKKALSAGLADVEVFGYKNNAIKMEEYTAAQSEKNGFLNKNLGTNRNLLTELSEEAELTYRVHLGKSKTKMDTTVLNARGLHGIKEEFIGGQYVYTYGNESKPKDIEKYYKKALSAGLAEVDVFGYKNNVIKMDDFVAANTPPKSFFGKNLNTDRHQLSELSEEAGLTYRVHLGKSKTKMDTTVLNAKGLYGIKEEFINDQYVYTYGNEAKPKNIEKYYKKALSAGLAEVDVFGYKNNAIKMDDYVAANTPPKSFFSKNIAANRNGLSDLNEDLDVTFRVHLGRSKTKMDTTTLHAKGIYGIKEEFIAGEYVYTYGNEAKTKDIEKLYNKALQAGIKPEVFAYKKDAIVMDPYLASVQYNNPSNKNGGNNQNLGAIKTTLLDLSENAEIDFKVYLGKSKTKRDTSYLAKQGMKNITEEFKDGEYYYTFGKEGKLANIEKYYKLAAKAGIKDPVIIAYKNQEMIPNQINSQKVATFGEEKMYPEILADVKPKKPKNTETTNREDEEIHKAMTVAMASAEKALEASASSDKIMEKALNKEMDAPVVIKTEESVNPSVVPSPTGGPEPPKNEPQQNVDLKLPPAIRPDDVRLKDVPSVDAATEETLNRFIEKYGDASAKQLEFRVQISAFKYRNRYEFPHLENLGVIENTVTEGGITRITIGGVFDTYKKAMAHNKKVVAAGQKDAFVTIFYQGKRVYPENLERMGIFLTK